MRKQLTVAVFDNSQEQESFGAIKNLYQHGSNEIPNSDIDKQVLAAAQRELANPGVRATYEVSWWRRLSLPLYAAAVFAFTAIGAHWYWPKPARVPPGTAPSPIVIDVVDEKQLQLEQTELAVKKHKLPDEKPLKKMPSVTQTKRLETNDLVKLEVGLVESFNIKAEALKFEFVAENHNDNKENLEHQADEVNYHDKEKWAKEIILMFKLGDYQGAQQALIGFKTAYPDYPIDEQIEAFRR